MATVNKKFADELIAGNGFHPSSPEDGAPDNPPAVKIVEYDNVFDRKSYGVVFAHDRDPMRYERTTEYVRNPRVIWERST